jgi:hypothetical protein
MIAGPPLWHGHLQPGRASGGFVFALRELIEKNRVKKIFLKR